MAAMTAPTERTFQSAARVRLELRLPAMVSIAASPARYAGIETSTIPAEVRDKAAVSSVVPHCVMAVEARTTTATPKVSAASASMMRRGSRLLPSHTTTVAGTSRVIAPSIRLTGASKNWAKSAHTPRTSSVMPAVVPVAKTPIAMVAAKPRTEAMRWRRSAGFRARSEGMSKISSSTEVSDAGRALPRAWPEDGDVMMRV